MKLNAPQLENVEKQLGVEALAEENPAMPKLVEVFGDHSFFLDAEGLNIVEPNPEAETENGTVVKVATWTEDRTQLQVHEPEILPVTVEFATADPDGYDPSA